MQIEIGRERSAAARAALVEALAGVLGDVRAAVADWPKMRAGGRPRSAPSMTVARRAPPPLPPAEIAEGVDFLRWLDAEK